MDHIRKLFSRIPKKHRLQIIETISCLLDPECSLTLKPEKLSGSALLRIRVGRYRIIYYKNEKGEVLIDDVRLRDENTYRDV